MGRWVQAGVTFVLVLLEILLIENLGRGYAHDVQNKLELECDHCSVQIKIVGK